MSHLCYYGVCVCVCVCVCVGVCVSVHVHARIQKVLSDVVKL